MTDEIEFPKSFLVEEFKLEKEIRTPDKKELEEEEPEPQEKETPEKFLEGKGLLKIDYKKLGLSIELASENFDVNSLCGYARLLKDEYIKDTTKNNGGTYIG